jgi:hypothetical protein
LRKKNLLKLNEKLTSDINQNKEKIADYSDESESRTKDKEKIEKLKLEMEFFSLDPKPSFIDLFMYYFCHVGILTGPYFKYRTFYDWLNSRYCGKVNPTKLILNRSKSLPIILILHSILSKYASFKVIPSVIYIYIYT